MRAERINTDLIDFLSVSVCDIDKSVNQHGKAVIRGVLKEGERAIEKISDVTRMSVLAIGDTGKKVIFSGVVESMSVQEVNGVTECEICLVGATTLMDIKRRTRTFQNADLPYKELIQEINSAYTADFSCGGKVEKAIKDFIVQYKETDWEFLIRIASNIDACIIPEYSIPKINYYIGLPHSTYQFRDDFIEYTRKKEINCLRNYGGRLMRNSEVDDVITFVHREILELGTCVALTEGNYYVYKIKSFLKKEELVHEYELRRKNDFEVKKMYNFMIVGASLDAKIIDVKAAKVKVKVDADVTQDKEKAKWFAYSSVFSSPDGTGWYCMPENGDKVRMYFPSEKESDAYIISSVHVDGATGSRTNPDNKSFMNKFNKQVELTPTAITLTNGKGMTFKMEDAEGITIISDKNITFLAEENVQMVSLNSSVELDATEKIELSQNRSKITLDGDITITAGEVHIQK